MAQVLLTREPDQPEFDPDHRYCSHDEIKHRIQGGACEGCKQKACPRCGLWNHTRPDGTLRCRSRFCREAYRLTPAELAWATHPRTMTHCNLCGMKLRTPKPRDKVRGRHFKD